MSVKAFDYVRLVHYGTIQSVQTWSCGLSLHNSAWGGVTNADLTTWLATIDTAAQAWWSGANSSAGCNTADVTYLGIKAEFYRAGTSAAESSADHPFSAALVGTSSTRLPTQTAAVISTLTDLAGRINRGRFYLPLTGAALSSGNKLSAAQVDTMTTAWQTYIRAINASSLAGSAPTVVVANSFTLPPPVTKIRMDNECDIQRRRADKILATYAKQLSI